MSFARVRALVVAATVFGSFTPAALTGQAPADSAVRDSVLKADSLYWASVLATARAEARLGTANDSLRQVAIGWLNAPVFFLAGESNIGSDMMDVLQLKGDLLKENKSLQVDLTGYADSVGDSASNRQLSLARAQSVQRFLVSYGVDRGQFDVTGAGEAVFARSTSSELARRVDFGVLATATVRIGQGVLSRILRLGRPWSLPAVSGRQSVATVTLLYATDREASGQASPDRFYGNGRRNTLAFGQVRVSVPVSAHVRGRIEERGYFGWLARVDERDSTRYFVLDAPVELPPAAWNDSLKSSIRAALLHEVFVYINGYNVTFRDAALKAAQLTVDLQLRSVPVLYSWPSYGETLDYVSDLDASAYTAPRLASFIRQVARETGAKRVNILAHSMGNRALLMAAQELRQVDDTLLGQVVLAAPDEDQQIFRDFIAELRRLSRRVTMYASSRDRALKIAQRLRSGRPRAGQAGPNLIVVEQLETIDASDVDTDFFAHGYHGNSLQVLDDLRLLLNVGSPAANRLTQERKLNGLAYWHLPPRTGR